MSTSIESIRFQLREAVQKCSIRGLKNSASWASEQLIGLQEDPLVTNCSYNNNSTTSNSNDDYYSSSLGQYDDIFEKYDHDYENISGKSCNFFFTVEKITEIEMEPILFTSSLLSMGEFQRCSMNLLIFNKKMLTIIDKNLKNFTTTKFHFSNLLLFLYFYSTYMTGEKIRINETASYTSTTSSSSSSSATSSSKIDSNTNVFSDSTSFKKNQFLPNLYSDLIIYYKYHKYLQKINRSDVFQLDGFMLYIFGVILRDYYDQYGKPIDYVLQEIEQQQYEINKMNENERKKNNNLNFLDPFDIFIESIILYPWNWSCWLEFSKLCIAKNLSIPSWDSMLSSPQTLANYQAILQYSNNLIELCSNESPIPLSIRTHARVMYAFFMSHIYLDKHRGDISIQVLLKIQQIFPSSLYLFSNLALSYYSSHDYSPASSILLSIHHRDPCRLAHIDTLSHILFLQEDTILFSYFLNFFNKFSLISPEIFIFYGNYFSLKRKHEEAIFYFQKSLKFYGINFNKLINNNISSDCSSTSLTCFKNSSSYSTFTSTWILLGHEYIEVKNISMAIKCYNIAQVLSPSDYRSYYSLGQVYEMLSMFQYSIYYYKSSLKLKSNDSRILNALGLCYSKINLLNYAKKYYLKSIIYGDHDGIANKYLAKLYKNSDRMDKAVEYYYNFLLKNIFANCQEDSKNNDEDRIDEDIMDIDSNIDKKNRNYLLYIPKKVDEINDWLELKLKNELELLLQSSITSIDSNEIQLNHNRISQANLVKLSGSIGGIPKDSDEAEGLLYLSLYCLNKSHYLTSEFFLLKLSQYKGPEGEEGKALLTDLRRKLG